MGIAKLSRLLIYPTFKFTIIRYLIYSDFSPLSDNV